MIMISAKFSYIVKLPINKFIGHRNLQAPFKLPQEDILGWIVDLVILIISVIAEEESFPFNIFFS